MQWWPARTAMPCSSSSWAMSCAWGSGSVKLTRPARFVGRWAEDVEAVDFAQSFVGVAGELVFVAGDLFEADEVEVIDRGAEGDGGRDRRRAGFELGRQLGGREAVGPDAVDHAAAAEERRHGVEQFFAAVQHADAGGGEHLVAAEGEEIGAHFADVRREVRHALGGIDQHDGAGCMCAAGDFLDRVDRAEHVGDRGDGDDFGAVGEQRVERVENQEAVVGDRNVLEHCAGALGQLLPGHEVRVVLHRGDEDFVAALTFASPQLRATRLMPAVVPEVKITSRACSAR